ncbi:Uncharacterised protein [[Pasteurella] mairii]|uniref:Transposase DDE domain-containing protein n=1 Tax=[Pasteurella] mairii TaxID=757 RepID=A0A379B540_9PAST|nr:Uncharacterised protein [[Pasteurella] mairii]
MTRDGKPKGFFYLDHRTVEGKHGIILDTFATAGNVNDSQPYIARLDEVRLSEKGKVIYARGKETVERSFADAKQHHGHRYARFRGLRKV